MFASVYSSFLLGRAMTKSFGCWRFNPLIVSLVVLFGALPFNPENWGHADERAVEGGKPASNAEEEQKPYVPKTKAELRRVLTPIQYKVTQLEGTEAAFRNLYWNNKKPGTYHCVVCDLPVFDSLTKFDSGTGWPSFFQPIDPKVVGYKHDWRLQYRRVEVHCGRCGAHFGHVFDDGPFPTGKRYCMNSASLKFYDRPPEEPQSVDSGEGK